MTDLLFLFTAITFILCKCVTASETITGIRLVDESGTVHPNKGRVEIQLDYNDHEWYGICNKGSNDPTHHSWNRMSATVACRQLNYLGGWNYSLPGVRTKFTLEDFHCGLDDDTLDRCSRDSVELCGCAPSSNDIFEDFLEDFLNQCNEDHYNHDQAAADCYDISSLDARLVPENSQSSGPSRSSDGKLEVKFRNQWYDVCYLIDGYSTIGWSMKDATVVCRQLGYELGAAETRRHNSNNYSHRQESFANFKCLGSESNLFACFPDRPRNISCGNNNQVYVQCIASGSDTTSAAGITVSMGLSLSSQNVTNWVIAGTIVGAILFITILIFGAVCLVYFIRKNMKSRQSYHSRYVEYPAIPHTNDSFRTDNLYDELTNGAVNSDYNYAYAHIDRRPSPPIREPSNPVTRFEEPMNSETPSEEPMNSETQSASGDSVGWVDNAAYVTDSNEDIFDNREGSDHQRRSVTEENV